MEDGKSVDNLLEKGLKTLEENYTNIEDEYNLKKEGFNGTSDFFELGENI
jgi:hypothetical protein